MTWAAWPLSRNHAQRLLFLAVAAAGEPLQGTATEVIDAFALLDPVSTVVHTVKGEPQVSWADRPSGFLPSTREIKKLSEDASHQRLRFWLCALGWTYLATIVLGTGILVLGTKFRSHELVGRPERVEARARLLRVIFVVEYSAFLGCTVWSVATGRLSKKSGLDWELYWLLFACNCLWLLAQAGLVAWTTRPGTKYGVFAFTQASVAGTLPPFADSFDTLKDVMFGGQCLQSEHIFLKVLGVLSWGWLAGVYFYFFSRPECVVELQISYTSVLVVPSKNEDEQKIGLGTRILGELYKQTTPGKRKVLMLENGPQAVAAIIFICCEGGSHIVAVLNLIVPIVQITLAYLIHPLLKMCIGPYLANQLQAARQDGNPPKQQVLLDDLETDLDLAREVVRNSPPLLRDVPKLESCDADEEGKSRFGLPEMAAVRVAMSFQKLDFRGTGITTLDAIGQALQANTTLESLDLSLNQIVSLAPLETPLAGNATICALHLNKNLIEDIAPLGRVLDSNRTLLGLHLAGNRIVDVSAISAGLAKNKTLVTLDLTGNAIVDINSLGQALESNTSLEGLYLASNSIEDISALGSLLEANRTLTTLVLTGNRIQDVTPLGRGLGRNATLTELRAASNRIEDFTPLATALQGNTVLTLLDIAGNKGKDPAPLQEALAANATLQTLYPPAGLQAALEGSAPGRVREPEVVRLTRAPLC